MTPNYKEKLVASIKDPSHFAACFDDSFNSVSYKKQLALREMCPNTEFFPVFFPCIPTEQ